MPIRVPKEVKKWIESESIELEAEFAGASRMRLGELKKLFKTDAEKKELKALIRIVSSATDENEAKAALARNIRSYTGAVFKIVKATFL